MILKRGASYSLLFVASFLSLFPLFWTISTSIKDRVDTYSLPPKFFSFTPTPKELHITFFSGKVLANLFQ